MKKIIITIVVVILGILFIAGAVNQGKTASATLNYDRQIAELKASVDAQQSAIGSLQSVNDMQQSAIGSLQSVNDTQQSAIDSLQSVNDTQQSAIGSLQSVNDTQQSAIGSNTTAISTINEYNRTFVTVPNADTEYHLFDRMCGTFQVVALRSGDNYIDFYDSTGTKVSSLTFNLSKNDVLFVSYYNNGGRATFMKLHDGSNASMKDYVASSTETLAYFRLTNANNEALITISA